MIGIFQFRHFSKFGRLFRIRDGPFCFPRQNISRGIECTFELPDVAGHAIDHRSNIFFLRRVVADSQDLFIRKIWHGALDLRNEPEAADHARAFDTFEFGRRLAGSHEGLAFGLPFTDELLQQSVFFDRSGHLLAGRILGGCFFCSSAHSSFLLINGFRRFS